MKLARRLYLYFITALIVALLIFGFLSYRRETRQLEMETIHNLRSLGRTVAGAFHDLWQAGDHQGALAIIRDATLDSYRQRVGWFWLDRPDRTFEFLRLNPTLRTGLFAGKIQIRRGYYPDGVEGIFAYFPVWVDGRMGAVEVSEPLAPLREKVRDNAFRLAELGGVLIISFALLMALEGKRLVGSRMQALVRFAQHIGAGNFDRRLRIAGNDEISQLCHEMNAMAHHLCQAQKKLVNESEARIEALEQLRHAERLATLGKLSSGMAHELGTPLNVVSGRAKLIETEHLSTEEITDNASIIRQQAERMTKIIQQMLDYARLRPPRRSRASFSQLIDQVFSLLESNARRQGVSLKLTGNTAIPPIAVDQAQILQVLTNLILNGIQSMPKGGELTVNLAVTRCCPIGKPNTVEADHLRVEIRDHGIGIAQEHLAQVFEPFFTTKPVGRGTGLGLSIAQGIIQEHQGWIKAAQADKGTVFTFFLPYTEAPCTDES